jgi:hypothetical protein
MTNQYEIGATTASRRPFSVHDGVRILQALLVAMVTSIKVDVGSRNATSKEITAARRAACNEPTALCRDHGQAAEANDSGEVARTNCPPEETYP